MRGGGATGATCLTGAAAMGGAGWAGGGAAGRTGTAGEAGVAATDAAGGAGLAAAGGAGGAGGRTIGAGGRVVCGVMNLGAGAGVGLASTTGGRGAAERGAAGVAAACCFCVISFSTSPGLEMCERSILVLISSASRPARGERDGALASAEARKWARTFSASWSSRELEWVFFSVTPTSVRTSRIALLLTSSSLARSLIRILLIRPFFAPLRLPKSSFVTSRSQRCTAHRRVRDQRGNSRSWFWFGGGLFLPALGLPGCVFDRARLRRFCSCGNFRSLALNRRFGCDFFCFYGTFNELAFGNRNRTLAALQTGEVIIDCQTDFFHRFGANSLNRLELLGRHIRQGLHGGDPGRAQLFDQPFAQAGHILEWSRSLLDQRRHLLFHFLPLLFLALDVDLPAQQLGRQPDVLPLLANGQRQLGVVHHHFEVLLGLVDHGHAADFGRLQSLLRKRHGILVILDDVDLLAAQFADDGLHAHAFHADASAHSIHVLVLRHHGNLGALAGFPRDGPNHHRPVVDFGNFGLEQMLHQIRRRTRHHHLRTLRSLLDARDDHAHALSDGKRLQARLLLAWHARFGFADVENDVWTFDALHGRVHDLTHARDVLVVNRVALRLAHLLENHLLGKLGRDAAEDAFGHFRNLQLPAHFDVRVQLASVFEGHLQDRILHLLGILDHGLDRECTDLAGVLVQFGPEVFLRLVVLAGSHHNGVFHRTDHNLRINPFFPAQRVDRVIELTCHIKFRYQNSETL